MPTTSESAQQRLPDNSSAPMPLPSTVPEHTLARSASARYPSDLARNPRARVPLQTRTDTYERLEDLLREAGYKETRIFTPEAERYEEEGKAEDRATLSVGAVVGFIAGLMRTSKEKLASQDMERSNPVKSGSEGGNLSGERSTARPATLGRSPSSTSSLDAARSYASSQSEYVDITTPRRQAAHQAPNGNSKAYHELDRLHRQLPQPRQTSRPKPINSHSQPLLLSQSPAGAYLRHMTSAPNIQSRPGPSSHGTEEEPQPPLPPTWLEVVTKAVLGSGIPGAHTGGPGISNLATASIGRVHSQRVKSKRSHSVLSDRTNARVPLVPPTIILTRSMSSTAPVVSTTQVVCQSAPSSRCPSRAGSIRSVRRGRGSVRRLKDVGKDRLPSLASTRVESDALNVLDAADVESDDGSDEDGEIDLARLLAPLALPKKQNSIKSLREHLHRSQAQANASRWEEEEGGFDWKMRDGEEDAWTVGTFDRSGTKRRRGIPNGWVQWPGSRA